MAVSCSSFLSLVAIDWAPLPLLGLSALKRLKLRANNKPLFLYFVGVEYFVPGVRKGTKALSTTITIITMNQSNFPWKQKLLARLP